MEKFKGKELSAVVMNVGSNRVIEAFVKELNLVIRINNAYITTPISHGSQFQAKDLKFFTQKQLLHQDCTVTIVKYNADIEQFSCVIMTSKGKNFANLLLKNGFAKLESESLQSLAPKAIRELKNHQEMAQMNNMRMWKNSQ